MNRIRLGSSALLITGGAVLAWAVTYEAEGVDLNRVGLIVFLAGLALAGYRLVDAAFASWLPLRAGRKGSAARGPRPAADRRHDRSVDREVAA